MEDETFNMPHQFNQQEEENGSRQAKNKHN